MTPQQFKQRWESSDDGDGITYADIAECAADWGVTNCQRILPIDAVRTPNQSPPATHRENIGRPPPRRLLTIC